MISKTRSGTQSGTRWMRNMNCRLLANLPTCLLAYLPTCLLANLPAILTMLSRRASRSCVSSPVLFLLVPFPRLVPPFRPVLIVSPSRRAIREAGRFFSSALVSFVGAVFHHAPCRFRKLILAVISSCRLVLRLVGRIAGLLFYSSRGNRNEIREDEERVFYLT